MRQATNTMWTGWHTMKLASAAVMALMLIGVATAAMAGDTLTVTATGVARAKPTQVELTASVSGEAELAKDALVKYRDSKRRAIEALGKLEIKDLGVRELGVSAGMQANQQAMMAIMQGNPNPNMKPNYQFKEQLRLTVKGIDKMDSAQVAEMLAKVIDASRDAGLTVGPQPPTNMAEMQMMQRGGLSGGAVATFRLTDTSAARAQAYETAVKDAKARAQKLAEASGLKLGPVVSIQEIPAGAQPQASNDNDDTTQAMLMAMYGWRAGVAKPKNSDDKNPGEPTSDSFEDIAVPVSLVVQFSTSK